ncbi:MAG: hypothetical protein AB1801_02165 [Chloroflexota bacterium]
MLNSFDWLRRSRSGAELLATLEYLETGPEFSDEEELGPPPSALTGPCLRCWIYPRCSDQTVPGAALCKTCTAIVGRALRLGDDSRRSIVVWGFVNRLPGRLRERAGFYAGHILGAYVHDPRRFLLMLSKHELKPWLQELVLYHGPELTGLMQIFPTVGIEGRFSMGDILSRAIQREADFGSDRLRIQFYAQPYQVTRPRVRAQEGILTFEVAEFLSLLEMAAVFRTLLRPDEQEALQKLLTMEDAAEAQFYWGRFLGYLSQAAKDMLSAWKIRQWPEGRVQLLYELVNYVGFYSED